MNSVKYTLILKKMGTTETKFYGFSMKMFFFLKSLLYTLLGVTSQYCRSGNIREVLIFANFARRTNSQIQESRKNSYKIALIKKN